MIAAAGGVKKDILERSISSELEQLMERRECYERGADEQPEVLISSQAVSYTHLHFRQHR